MALLIFGLNEERNGWGVLGKITDGEIVEDLTGELKTTIRGAYDLDDEDHLGRALNDHYINAVPLAENEE